jgi:small-conductance mechanosensitive channel
MPQAWGSVTGVAVLLALLLVRALFKARDLPPPPWRLPVVAVALQWLTAPLAALLPVASRQLVLLLDDLVGAYALLVVLSWGVLVLPPSLGIGRSMPQILRDLLSLAVGALLTVVTLQQARVNLVGLVTTSAVLTAVIGLAAQETLKDLFGGLSMQIGAAYRVGDWVDLGEHRGRVESITLMNTVLRSLDGAELVIPNSQAAAASLRRFRPHDPVGHRFSLGLDYSHPPAQAMRLLLEVAQRHPDVLHEPEPRVWIQAYGDSAIQYELLVFQREAGDGPTWRLRGELLEQLWYALNREDRRIPFPVLELRQHHHAPPEPDEHAWDRAERRADLLATNPLFATLSEAERATLAPLTRCLRFGPGETVVREGDQGDCLYQVVSGSLEVSKQADLASSETIEVARLEPTAVFGEMTLCTDAPRNATVRTLTETVLLEVERSDLVPLLEANPPLLEQLGALVSARQRELQRLSDAGAAEQTSWLIERMRQLFAGLG